jgi:hypothetical protein
MPYIEEELRIKLEKRLYDLISAIDWIDDNKLDGVMNYVVTKIIRSQYNYGSYAGYNSAVGVLECAKLELYRRAIAPYEDIKIKVNGDV